MLKREGTVNSLHLDLQVANFQRCKRVFHQSQVWVKLQPGLCLLLLDCSGLPCPSSSLFSSQQLFLPGHEMPALVCQLLYYTTVLFKVLYCKTGGSQVVLVIKNPPANGGDWSLAWQCTPVFLSGESPWTEEPGELQSTVSQRVRHDWSTWHVL